MRMKLQWIFSKFKYGISLKYKLLISYFLLIIIPLTIFLLISLNNISKQIKEQSLYSSNQVLKQTASLLEYRINNIIYISDQIFFNNNLNQTLLKDENLPVGPELVEDYNNVRNFISNSFSKNNMDKMTLYLNDDIYYSGQELNSGGNANIIFSKISYISNESWYKELDNFNGKILWIPPSYNKQSDISTKKVVSGVRFIKNTNNYSENIGVLRIDLLESNLDKIIGQANTTKTGVAFIQNSNGKTIASSNEKSAGEYNISPDEANELSNRSNNWDITEIGNKKVIIGSENIANTDWNLISITSYKEIMSADNQTRNELFILMLTIGSLAYVLAYFISSSISKRIRSLTKRVKRVQNGDFTHIMNDFGNDEISELSNNYNYMLNQLDKFSKMQYKSGQEVKNAELKALQAQINPHFLYNTLDLINWTALKNKVPEISEIILALTKFYKLSLGNGKDVVPIKDEIIHIETYVKLQNYRFKNRIKLLTDIEEKVYEYDILKLILQPIIENSILHGILEKQSKSGYVEVSARISEGIIVFNIKDDGVGILDEKIRTLFEGDANKDQHYGLKNVNQRIKLHYGNEFGITCRSVVEQGTVVNVIIPAEKLNFN